MHHRNARRRTPGPALPPLRRDHADQPRRSGVGGAAAAEVGGRSHRPTSGRCRRAASQPARASAAAALRELEEETGVTSVELLAEAPGWLSYDLPDELLGIALKGRYRGQRQKWFAMRFTGDDVGDRYRPARRPQGRVRRLALGRRCRAAAADRALQAAGLLRRRARVCGLCGIGPGSAASFRRYGRAWS